MADLKFEREVRTPYSEAYLVMEQERQVGRVDIHFAAEMVHVAVSVDESLTQETVQQIIDTVDEDMSIPKMGSKTGRSRRPSMM